MSQITTHVLDTARGAPAEGIAITLYRKAGDDWSEVGGGLSNADGRLDSPLTTDPLPAGVYRMHFATEVYFTAGKLPVFYPWVDVVFTLGDAGEHYHIPLLLAPYGYSTYRGS